MWITLDQWMIAILGSLASWIIHDERKNWRLWACIFALAAQPFWFFAAWKAQQWGIFAMDIVYTLGWIKGFWQNWRK